MRPAAKRDGNEDAIIVALEALGCTVEAVSSSGHPDLLVGLPGPAFRLILIEVKVPGERLTPKQKKFHAKWQEFPVFVAFSVAEALTIVRMFK